MDDKSEKLGKLFELLRTDTLTPAEVKQFLEVVLGVIKTSKDNFDTISKENLRAIEKATADIKAEHTAVLQSISDEILSDRKDMKTKVAKIKSIIAQIASIKPADGVDGLDGADGKDGKDGSPDTRLEIIGKINTGVKDDIKISSNQIDGFEKLSTQANVDRAISILDQRTQYLINKRTSSTFISLTDVPQSYAGQSGNALRVKSDLSGLEFYTPTDTAAVWGQITGTLANQVDLQAALDAKQATGNYITALTGDVTASGPGSVAATLATVNSNVGTFGSATKSVTATVNGKGLVTAISEQTITPAASSITGAGDITRTNDTNVTLTLGGTPTGAVLKSTSFTLGWTGTLGLSRGGTNADLSGTGGASQVLKQTSVGGAITVAQLAASDLSNGVTGSGAVVLATSPTLTTAILGSSTATTQAPADNSTKIATTAYVDAAVLGQNFKEAAKYATTAALPSVIYANGSSGVGATLTGVALAAISVDSASPGVGDRILVKNQVSTFQNGIYLVTQTGSGIAVFILTRTTDANQTGEYKTGDSLFVTSGTVNSSTTWAYTGIDSPVIGTDAITYAQTAGQGTVTAGNGITVTGLSVAIDTSVTVDKTTAQTLTNKTLTSPVINSPTGIVKADVGLGSVTNDAQTKASIVPNTAPSSGQILFGNAGGTAYAPQTMSGDATVASTGALTLKNTGTAGTYGSVILGPVITTDAQGRVTAVSTVTRREVLTAARTYFVRTDGSDSNTGLANTAGGAFLTVQKAVNVATSLDLSIYGVTIQVGDGTYTGAVTCASYIGAGPITIQGNSSTPTNVSLSVTSATAITMTGVIGKYVFKDFQVKAATSGFGMSLTQGSIADFSGIDFGQCVTGHINIDHATLTNVGNYTISAGSSGGGHININYLGYFFLFNVTVTLSGTPVFASPFVFASQLASVVYATANFVGGATGTRFSISLNSVCQTNGGGANYFPGNVAGATATGGQYV